MVKITSGDLSIYVEGTYEQIRKKFYKAFNYFSPATKVGVIEITGYLDYEKQTKATAYFSRTDDLLIIDLSKTSDC